MTAQVHPSLLADMNAALLSEFGARSIYPLLARRTRDPDLSKVLLGFHEDECGQIELLRALITALGGRPRAGSRRRAVLARLLYLSTYAGALRFALRLCHESESTLVHGYHQHAHYLAEIGEPEHARTSESLALTKRRHAQTLEIWVEH